jgi:cell division septation protein DedD
MNQPPRRDENKEAPPPAPLKARIDLDEDEVEDKGSNLLAIGMLAAIVIIGAFVGWSMMTSSKKGDDEHQTATAEETPEPPPPDTTAQDTTALAQKPPDPPKPPAPKSEPTQTPPPPAAEPASFGIQVGTYLFEDRAKEVLAELSTSAAVTGRVVPGSDGSFAVVLGPFDSRSAAESKGSALLESGAVRESRVVPLKD